MLNLIRTRLRPGHHWVTPLPITMASNEPAGSSPTPPPRPTREPQGSPGAAPTPAAPLPGLDVSELNSDTMFDRFFGTPTAPAPPRR